MPCLMYLLRERLHILPIVTTGFIFASFLISYVVAVSNGHVEPDFPYISHTAIETPERSIFAQMVNVGAFMLALNVGVRLLQMSAFLKAKYAGNLEQNTGRRDFMINTIAAGIGVLSAFGLTLVANFQTPEMKEVHYIGAGLSFILGTCYCWMQTALSIRNLNADHSRRVATIAQFINSSFLTICFILFVISKIYFRVRESQGYGTKYDSLRPVYLVSTITEWLTALSIVTFAMTFYSDFKAVKLILPTVKIVDTDYVDSRYINHSQAKSQRPNQEASIV